MVQLQIFRLESKRSVSEAQFEPLVIYLYSIKMASNFAALDRTVSKILQQSSEHTTQDDIMPAIYVINRHGDKVAVHFDIITQRNELLRSSPMYGPPLTAINSSAITAEVVRRFRNGMTTRELDAETAAICIDHSTHHIDYDHLAARVYVSDLHKRTPAQMHQMVADLIKSAPTPDAVRYSEEFIGIVNRAAERLITKMDSFRDYRLNFFGFQTIARSYLLRADVKSEKSSLIDTQLSERPQHLYMRIAIGIFVCQPDGQGHLLDDEKFNVCFDAAEKYYDALSLQLVSNATPTILNAGTKISQLSSCFQLATGDDLPTLCDTLKSAALISKWSGGISLWLHNVRAEGSPIRKTGGRSTGIKHYMKILNDMQIYVNQGGNRPGAFAIYLSVDHDDIFTFLSMARLKGEEALRSTNAPDLKYALWVPDLFMEIFISELEGTGDGTWYLFDPNTAPGLHLYYGPEYSQLYYKYVAEGRARRSVKASEIISEAFKTWIQVGTPYVMFKDHINRKSNMQNVGPICSSNLCTEILIPSWSAFDAPDFARFNSANAGHGEFGVCNLAAICLENFIIDGTVDFAGIAAAAALETNALNRIIDINYYPSIECQLSNRRHRPIGIGIMGLANVLAQLNIIYGSPEACNLAAAIAATVYFGALQESCTLADMHGAYESFAGSPISRDILQPDLWVNHNNLAPDWEVAIEKTTNGFLRSGDWAVLRARAACGVRNAYLTAYMPTATTSNIVGQNECFEPFTSNIYTRKTLAGEFLVINRSLMQVLNTAGLWNDDMRREIIAAGGSIQGIDRIPQDIRRVYRTAREMHPSLIIRMAKALSPFICQSMSMNLYLDEPNLPKIIRFLVEGWEAGLKTGMYYCHTQPAAGSQKTSVVVTTTTAAAPLACTSAESCTSCVL
jgi:ribonucleoside-diphosphate reductase alpha chain